MTKHFVALALAAIVVAILPAHAQSTSADLTDMDALRNAVRTDKKALVASTLNLTPVEAKKFWPIYDEYQRSLEALNRKRALVVVSVVSKDEDVSGLYAKNLASELITGDEAEIKARRTMYNKLMRALPPLKAAQYLQLEAKIRALLGYDIASTIPLIR